MTTVTEEQGTRPFDLEELLARCVGNMRFAHRVLRRFMSCFEEDLQRVESHLQANNWEETFRVVHTMRGSAANIGARRLEGYLASLERLAIAREPAEASSQLMIVREEWGRVAESISQLGVAGENVPRA
jgi:HPt (histidine-containing phosphotransfer) domain-containing protein